jgi:hypothetical protein
VSSQAAAASNCSLICGDAARSDVDCGLADVAGAPPCCVRPYLRGGRRGSGCGYYIYHDSTNRGPLRVAGGVQGGPCRFASKKESPMYCPPARQMCGKDPMHCTVPFPAKTFPAGVCRAQYDLMPGYM